MEKNRQPDERHPGKIDGRMDTEMNKDMIDLYTRDVGRNLPEKIRADIEREIRSTIEDTLEDESRRQGSPVNEGMVSEVLKKMGSPRKVAASYLPPRYLIGPDLFPAYIFVLRVVISFLIAIGVIFIVISMGLSVGQTNEVGQAIIHSVGQAMGWFLNTAIWSAGIITLAFAILQWTGPRANPKPQEWDPRTLKTAPDPERIDRLSKVVEISLSLIAIVLFNFYPQLLGVASMVNGHWVVVPILTQAILSLVPWYTLVMVLTIFHCIDLIIRGRWSTASHWEHVILDVFTVILSIRVITGPAIIAFPADLVSRLGWGIATPDAMVTASDVTNTVLRVLVGLGILTQGLSIAKGFYHLLIKRPFSEEMRMG